MGVGAFFGKPRKINAEISIKHFSKRQPRHQQRRYQDPTHLQDRVGFLI